MRVVVTGANRGIGFELVKQLLARGDQVHAGVRSPEQATELAALRNSSPGLLVNACDVSVEDSVQAFASTVGGQPVDVLINNAGMNGSKEPLETLDIDDCLRCFQVNALGALRMTRALLPNLRSSKIRKVAHLSSVRASITENTTGNSYGYRMSKIALNMMSRSLAVDLRGDGILSVAIHPGWVQTAMGGPNAPLPARESVKGLLRVIESLTPEMSGSFVDYNGEPLPF